MRIEASSGKVNSRPYLKNTIKAKDKGCGSNDRALAGLLVQSPTPHTQKQTNKQTFILGLWT